MGAILNLLHVLSLLMLTKMCEVSSCLSLTLLDKETDILELKGLKFGSTKPVGGRAENQIQVDVMINSVLLVIYPTLSNSRRIKKPFSN